MSDDRAGLVENLRIRESGSRLFFEYDGDADWNAASPALADPLATEVTLTATDPDGLSASLTGRFQADWESQPVVTEARFQGQIITLTFKPAGPGGTDAHRQPVHGAHGQRRRFRGGKPSRSPAWRPRAM